jgi:hypothetical protein
MKIILLVALALSLSHTTLAQRAECFPFERLSQEKQRVAEELLLKALDSEALYTLVGGLKPMSSGFTSFDFQVREVRGISPERAEELLANYPDAKSRESLSAEAKREVSLAESLKRRTDALSNIDSTREILRHFRCDDRIFADIQHFGRTFEGRRSLQAVVFNLPSLESKMREKAGFFERFGVTPNSHPLQILYAVDYEETSARFAGYGYLFGYPDNAVRFFVQAADEENFTGRFVERDFLSLPTFSSPTNRFVYAVPKGHVETEEDRRLKEKALIIFEEYKKWRELYIGEGKKGVVEMMRDWLLR